MGLSVEVRHLATQQRCARQLVQELLSHSTIGVTLGTYSHVLPGMSDGLADTMDEALGQRVAAKGPSVASGPLRLLKNTTTFYLQTEEKRRGWDSNPRDDLTPPTRFPIALLRPTRTPLRERREFTVSVERRRGSLDELRCARGSSQGLSSPGAAGPGQQRAGRVPSRILRCRGRASRRRRSGFESRRWRSRCAWPGTRA